MDMQQTDGRPHLHTTKIAHLVGGDAGLEISGGGNSSIQKYLIAKSPNKTDKATPCACRVNLGRSQIRDPSD